MIPLWLDGIPHHYDLVVPHMLSLALVRTIIILEISPEMTYLVDPGYNLLPTSLSHNSERDVRVCSSQPNQFEIGRWASRSETIRTSIIPGPQLDYQIALPILWHLLAEQTYWACNSLASDDGKRYDHPSPFAESLVGIHPLGDVPRARVEVINCSLRNVLLLIDTSPRFDICRQRSWAQCWMAAHRSLPLKS